jgi:hypothetical protein
MSPIPRPRVQRVATTLAAVPALASGTAGAPTGSAAQADTANAGTAPTMDCTGVAALDLSNISGRRVSRLCRTRFPPESQSTRRTPTTLPRICAWSPGIGS